MFGDKKSDKGLPAPTLADCLAGRGSGGDEMVGNEGAARTVTHATCWEGEGANPIDSIPTNVFSFSESSSENALDDMLILGLHIGDATMEGSGIKQPDNDLPRTVRMVFK